MEDGSGMMEVKTETTINHKQLTTNHQLETQNLKPET